MDALEQTFTPCADDGAKTGNESANKRVTVVLVDEMDLLVTKKQQVRACPEEVHMQLPSKVISTLEISTFFAACSAACPCHQALPLQ